MRRKDLRQAYLQAHYRFFCGKRRFTLRIGGISKKLVNVFKKEGVRGAAYLSASNPHSRPAAAAANQRANARLLADIKKRTAARLYPALGVDPHGKWPAEESILALGLSRAQANHLAKKYRQNAFVWVGASGKVSLVWAA
jgi:hypothetical protein